MPLPPLVDVAVVSVDFCPPLLERSEIHGIAGLLCGFGITRVVRTRGPEPVEWVWDERQGTTAIDEVEALFTFSAGDAFHGAFAWAPGILHEGGREILEDLSRLIALAAQTVSVSTSVLGIRSRRDNPRVVEVVERFLSFSEAEGLRRGSASK